MYTNQDPTQTRHLPTRLKLMLAIPLAILVVQLLFLAFAGSSDPVQPGW
jgi:hypothetical protein